MKYRIVLDTIYDGKNGILFEGSKEDCDTIMSAFIAYNNSKNISIEEVTQETNTDTIVKMDGGRDYEYQV